MSFGVPPFYSFSNYGHICSTRVGNSTASFLYSTGYLKVRLSLSLNANVPVRT